MTAGAGGDPARSIISACRETIEAEVSPEPIRQSSREAPSIPEFRLSSAAPSGADLDLHRDGGRDRDRLVERSVMGVIVDQLERLLLGGAAEPEVHVDADEDRGVAATAPSLQVHLDAFQGDVHVPCSSLNEEHSAGRDAREERVSRRDLLARTAQVGRLVDRELVLTDLVDGAPGSRGGGGPDTVQDELVIGHGQLAPPYQAGGGCYRLDP